MEKLLTVKQIAEYLQVSPRTVYEGIHIGFIPHYKFSRGVRFKISEVERWVKGRRVKGRVRYRIFVEEQKC